MTATLTMDEYVQAMRIAGLSDEDILYHQAMEVMVKADSEGYFDKDPERKVTFISCLYGNEVTVSFKANK